MDKKIYLLIDCIDDELILAGYDKKELLTKVGEDFLSGEEIDSYRLKSVRVEDLYDEPI